MIQRFHIQHRAIDIYLETKDYKKIRRTGKHINESPRIDTPKDFVRALLTLPHPV